jgi:DNA-binding MarR family transcriptional regulator
LLTQPLRTAINLLSGPIFWKVLTMPPRSASPEQQLLQDIGRLIPRVRRSIWAGATHRLEARGETMLAWQVLGGVRRTGPSTQRELAEAVSQHPAGVCRLLDDLEKRGLVTRTRDTGDRRRMIVRVTAAGRRRWQTLLPEVVRSVEKTVSPLSDAERRSLRDLLRKVVSGHDDAPNSGARNGR